MMNRKSNIIFNILCLVSLIGTTTFLIIKWNSIPSVIVTHYDFFGNADGFGKKTSILLTPIMAWILYIVLTAVAFFPSLWNVGFKITEENKHRVYATVLTMLNIIKTIIIFSFCYMTICTVLEYRLPAWFTIAELITIFGTVIIYLVKLYKVR